MRAWLYVFRHAAFAVTDSEGRFRIEGVPVGTWSLRAHHADGALESKIEVVVARDSESEVVMEIVVAGRSGERE